MRIEPKHCALIRSTFKLPFSQIANVFDSVAEAQRTASRHSAV
jgi:hypothetical protein